MSSDRFGRKTAGEERVCQVDFVKNHPEKPAKTEQLAVEIKHLLRQVKFVLMQPVKKAGKVLARRGSTPAPAASPEELHLNLQPGEQVRVKSAEQIKGLLDEDGKYQGCLFTDEMWNFCGTETVVFKQVNSFLNETNNKIQKISHTVLLKDLYCSGARAFGERCDRSCFLFWKEAWLERIEKS